MNVNINGTELVTYSAPLKPPFSEAVLELLSNISIISRIAAISTGGVLLIMFLIDVAILFSVRYYHYEPFIDWPVYSLLFILFAAIVALSVVTNRYWTKERQRIYVDVLQGRIVSIIMEDNGEKSLKWKLQIEGNNSMNEIRTQWRSKKTSKDDDRLAIGDFVDFRKTSAD